MITREEMNTHVVQLQAIKKLWERHVTRIECKRMKETTREASLAALHADIQALRAAIEAMGGDPDAP